LRLCALGLVRAERHPRCPTCPVGNWDGVEPGSWELGPWAMDMLARSIFAFFPKRPFWPFGEGGDERPIHPTHLTCSLHWGSLYRWALDGVKGKKPPQSCRRHSRPTYAGDLPTQATWTGDTAKAGCLGGGTVGLVATGRSVSIKTQTVIQAASSSAGSRRDRKMAGTAGSRAHHGSASSMGIQSFLSLRPPFFAHAAAGEAGCEIHDSVLGDVATWCLHSRKCILFPWQGSQNPPPKKESRSFFGRGTRRGGPDAVIRLGYPAPESTPRHGRC
jgi:hypothetical protein